MQSSSTSRALAMPTPPGGHWLRDDLGREYYLDRIPKKQAQRIDPNLVRNTWGIAIDVVKEDEQFYYYRVYKPVKSAVVPAARPTISASERQKIIASYRADIKTSERLRFTSFGQGLPTFGQWRDGFAIADMNGDGHPDIVHGPPRKQPSKGPVIFLGDGKGSWARWREATFPPLAYDYGDAQVADLNGDGHPDLAFGVHLRGLIALFGDGKGGFTDASQGLDFAIDGNTPFSSKALRLLDWNGDGRPDIIALGEGPKLMGRKLARPADDVVIYLNKGQGKWERRVSPQPTPNFGDSITIGDFDGDGHPDFAISTGAMGHRDLVNLWKPDGSWQPVTVDALRPMAYVWAVAAADFDGDGRADLAVAYTSDELGAWRSGIDVLFQRADKHWDRVALTSNESTEGPIALATGDLDGDGHQDLVALTSAGETLVFLGNGHGTFTREKTPPPTYPGGCRGAHAALSDLDGDGRDEIVASFADEPLERPGHCPSFGGLTAWKAQPAR